MLAAKAALATRLDALGEDGNTDMGIEHRANLTARLRMLEDGNQRRISGTGKSKVKTEKYQFKRYSSPYPTVESEMSLFNSIAVRLCSIRQMEILPSQLRKSGR